MFGVIGGLTRRRGGTQGRRIFRGLFSPKQGNKNFYKGYGARSLGKIDSKGHFHFVEKKIPQLMIPDLTGCPLKPYVAYSTPKVKVAPFKAPQLDMSKCEVNLSEVLFPRQASILRKAAESALKKKKKGRKTSQQRSDAPALSAPSPSL